MEEACETPPATTTPTTDTEATETATDLGDAGKGLKVLVAVDESEASLHALSWVLERLFTLPGEVPDKTGTMGSLIVVYVQPPIQPYFLGPGPGAFATSSTIEAMKKAHEENSAIVLSRALHICKEKLVDAKPVVIEGDPKEMICQAAEQMEADIVVVGSRGHSKIKRAFLGSVSDYVAHHAGCPVLIVKPSKMKT